MLFVTDCIQLTQRMFKQLNPRRVCRLEKQDKEFALRNMQMTVGKTKVMQISRQPSTIKVVTTEECGILQLLV